MHACIYIPLDDTPPPPTPEPPGENPPPEQPPGDEPEPTVPKAPCYLYGQYDPTLNEVLMHWNKPTNDGGLPITEYRVYRFSKGIIELIGVLKSNLDQISFVDKNLLPGTYQYYVTAVNSKGESQPSNSLIIETF